jgi:hypothetical protein
MNKFIIALLALMVTVASTQAQVVSQQQLVSKELGWYTVIQGNGNAVVTGAKPRYGFGDVGDPELGRR